MKGDSTESVLIYRTLSYRRRSLYATHNAAQRAGRAAIDLRLTGAFNMAREVSINCLKAAENILITKRESRLITRHAWRVIDEVWMSVDAFNDEQGGG